MKLIIKTKEIVRTNGEKSEIIEYVLDINGLSIILVPRGDYNYQLLVKSLVLSCIPDGSNFITLVESVI